MGNLKVGRLALSVLAVVITIEDGGHMLLRHQERVRSETVTFLQEHSSDRP
jgi:hypothetical protein